MNRVSPQRKRARHAKHRDTAATNTQLNTYTRRGIGDRNKQRQTITKTQHNSHTQNQKRLSTTRQTPRHCSNEHVCVLFVSVFALLCSSVSGSVCASCVVSSLLFGVVCFCRQSHVVCTCLVVCSLLLCLGVWRVVLSFSGAKPCSRQEPTHDEGISQETQHLTANASTNTGHMGRFLS